MSAIGKINFVNQKSKKRGFSLIEIIVSLAIFSFLITSVITITFTMIKTQNKIQAQLFLAQTAQTTLENMSRQIRYGYNYTGNTEQNFLSSEAGQTITINVNDISNQTGSAASSSQNLVNAPNSPFIIFEAQGGNPNVLADQNAYCAYNGKLYKITWFSISPSGLNYSARCDSGVSILPDSIILKKIVFDIYAGISENPKNPTVRLKMRLEHADGGEIEVQTSVSERLVTYF